LKVVLSSLLEEFAGFSVVSLGGLGFTLLSKADNFGQEGGSGEMFFHQRTSDTAVLGHQGESKAEVKFAGEDRFGKAFSSGKRSSTGSVDHGQGSVRLDTIVAEGKEAFSSDLNVSHVHGVVDGFHCHTTSDRATNHRLSGESFKEKLSDASAKVFLSSEHGS